MELSFSSPSPRGEGEIEGVRKKLLIYLPIQKWNPDNIFTLGKEF